MMQNHIPIFFFSGTGNTWWVSQQLADALGQNDLRAEAYSIEQVKHAQVSDLIEQAEIVTLGYPIYGSDAPLIMQDFIANLPETQQSKPMCVFVTQAAWSGDGAYFIRPEVEAKGYQIRWAVHLNMPNNICVDLGWFLNTFLGWFNAKPATAHKRITKLARKISQGRDWIMGKSPALSLGWMQRVPYRKGLASLQAGKLQVNPKKCNACGRCVRLCPVDNITLVDGLPRFATHCNLCLRCFNYCPELAVEAFGKPFNPAWYGEQPYQGPEPGFRPEFIVKGSKS